MKKNVGVAVVSMALLGWCGAASAADMAVKARPVPVVAVYSWTGCYGGVEAGGSWGRSRTTGNGLNNGVPNGSIPGALKTSTDLDGGLFGLTLGCNYQFNQFVFGIEGDGSWSGRTGGSFLVRPNFNPNFFEDVTGNWLATIRGRAGFVVNRTWLLYGTAGGAFADLTIHEFNPTGAVGSNGLTGATETHNFSGWTAGVGVEWGFAPNLSAKLEYLYLDLGRQNYFQSTATGCCTYQTSRFTDNVVRAGVNYHFNMAGPVVAKY